MPYTVDSANLPDNVKELSDKKKSQWVKIWNSAYDSCIDDDGTAKECESSAFAQANGVVFDKEREMESTDIITRVLQVMVEAFTSALEKVTGKQRAWSGAASDYDSTEDYCKACLIDMNSAAGRDEKAQSHCMLPVKSSGSDSYNFEGIQAAAGGHGVTQVKKPSDVDSDDWNSAVKKAANTIISQYNANDETAPDSVYKAADKEPPKERDMGLDRVGEQIWHLVNQGDEWVWPLGPYIADDGSLYTVLAIDGKLYRASVTVVGETVTLGEREQVTELFAPIQRGLSIHRQADGSMRWIMVAATAALNRVGEIDSTELFDNMITRAAEEGYPYLTFYHLGEKFGLGSVDYLARDKYVYINSGVLDEDNALAMAIVQDAEANPDYWGGSIHYDPQGEPEQLEVAPDIFVPVYRDGTHIETSIVSEKSAASLFTLLGAQNKEVIRMDKKIKEELEKLLGDDADLWVTLADEINRRVEGMVARSEGDEPAPTGDAPPVPTDNAPPAPTGDPPPVATQATIAEQTVEIGDEALAAIVREMAKSDAFQGLEESLTTLTQAVEVLGKQLESAQAASTEGLVEARERLAALEKDDEEKQREWLADLPARRMLRVSYRPREDNAPDGPAQQANLGDVAAATLVNMPRLS